NHSLVNHVVVMREELRRGVLTLFLGRRSPSPLRASLLQRGMFAAITGKYPIVETGEPELDGLVGDALYDPDLAVAAIVKFRDRTSVESFREKDREAAGVVESIRKVDAHLTVDDRRKLELGNLLREGSVADMLDEALLATGVDQKTFRSWLEDDSHQAAFTNAVPGINVTSTLMLARDQNQGHRTHPNDGKDFSFFQVAVPYSNILVAEKSWSHFAVSSGLAKLYGTLVLRDARAIPEALKDAGCL
ncbi:MAG: hypothetical protein M3O36_04770, partial [Myxococcota bacterium]|nr:hypothetical protein [Myxococcota bacterium]